MTTTTTTAASAADPLPAGTAAGDLPPSPPSGSMSASGNGSSRPRRRAAIEAAEASAKSRAAKRERETPALAPSLSSDSASASASASAGAPGADADADANADTEELVSEPDDDEDEDEEDEPEEEEDDDDEDEDARPRRRSRRSGSSSGRRASGSGARSSHGGASSSSGSGGASQGGGGAPAMPPFVVKLRAMCDRAPADVARWSEDGGHFEVLKPAEFSEVVHAEFRGGASSPGTLRAAMNTFSRQLHFYGFKRCEPELSVNGWGFRHPYFVRDEPDRIALIKRYARASDRAHDEAKIEVGKEDTHTSSSQSLVRALKRKVRELEGQVQTLTTELAREETRNKQLQRDLDALAAMQAKGWKRPKMLMPGAAAAVLGLGPVAAPLPLPLPQPTSTSAAVSGAGAGAAPATPADVLVPDGAVSAVTIPATDDVFDVGDFVIDNDDIELHPGVSLASLGALRREASFLGVPSVATLALEPERISSAAPSPAAISASAASSA